MDLAISNDMIPNVEIDQYSPLSDKHSLHVRELQREIAKLSVPMKPLHVDIAKLAHAGKSHREIAKELDRSDRTVTKVMGREDVRKLLFHLNLLRETIDAPNRTRRLHTLWRIAVDNETIRPKTAIDAISEMNRMTDSAGKGSGFTIVIQNNVLGRGPLD